MPVRHSTYKKTKAYETQYTLHV